MMRTTLTILWAIVIVIGAGASAKEPVLEIEEVVTRYTSAGNGAGPLWCYGSTVIARIGDDVYLSVIETGSDVPLLCNTRWQLWHRSNEQSWKIARHEQQFREREPCPIGAFHNGTVFLSVNPSTEPPGTKYGPCLPQVLEFDTGNLGKQPKVNKPVWAEGAYFTDHSYRGFAVDGANNELLLVNINARTSEQFVSYRDRNAKWHRKGKITFAVRACYPQVALKNKSAHILAIGDIVEPNEEWRKLKLEKLNRAWDYVFRRLFYTYTPDVEHVPFKESVEIDSVEKTGGHITNLDLYADESGVVHVLYLKRPHQYAFLRDKYFPGQPMTVHLEYMVIKEGKVLSHRTLAETPPEGKKGLEPSYARFHVDSQGDIYIIAAGTMRQDQQGTFGNFVARLDKKGRTLEFHRIDLKHPFRTFFTNTPRGGSKPCDTIDLFGIADDNPNLRYARIRLE